MRGSAEGQDASGKVGAGGVARARGLRAQRLSVPVLGLLRCLPNFIDRQLLVILQESIKRNAALRQAARSSDRFSFAIFYVSFGIPIARLADTGTRRSIVAMALAVWSGMTALAALLQSYVQLLLARIGVAVGEAGGSPRTRDHLDIFEGERRATALAVYSMGINIVLFHSCSAAGSMSSGWRMASSSSDCRVLSSP